MNYNSLTKQELITELENKNNQINTLKKEIEEKENEHDFLVNEMQEERENYCKQIKQESSARERFYNKIKKFLDTNIKDLITTGHDNHEEFGFELAKEYLKNQNQDFNKLKKEIYNRIMGD